MRIARPSHRPLPPLRLRQTRRSSRRMDLSERLTSLRRRSSRYPNNQQRGSKQLPPHPATIEAATEEEAGGGG